MDYFHSRRFLDTLTDWEKGQPPAGPLDHYLPRMRALLRRLDNPQARYPSIIVGGTNGKGTVASLLAALLQAAGHRVGLYTSPHLHNLRERIQIDGQLLDKDRWAAGLTLLYDRSRQFDAEGLGDFSRYEALTALAAQLFAEERPDYVVWEVGLGGRYDAANAWDADLAILTSISLDHTDVLGHDLLGIAADKLHIARPGQPLFTTHTQQAAVLEHIRATCRTGGIPLYIAAAEAIEGPTPTRPYPIPPAELPTLPGTFAINARLALAAAAHLLGDRLDTATARRTVEAHHWPGRFERAAAAPQVLLDGAHNPAAAHLLAADLKTLAPDQPWDFVIGAHAGHDASGILTALAPLARRLILTSSDHAKALPTEVLATLAPAHLQPVLQPDCNAAFRDAVKQAGPDGRICITGSLYLVARAREFFGLPTQSEGISEDVALESLECIRRACDHLDLSWDAPSQDGTLLRVQTPTRPLYFWRNKHPFNDYVGARLAEDKAYQYELFSAAGLPVPQTMQLFNPLADERFNRYKEHATVAAMVAAIERRFTYPLLVKKYRSSVSQGVFLQHNAKDLSRRLQTLFENSGFNDNILLVQSLVQGPEYRAVAAHDRLLLAYEKQGEAGLEDLNPLHHANGRAVRLTDPALLQRLADLVRRLNQVIDLGFYAIDLIDTPDGLTILEINPNPFCYFYNRTNGRADFTNIYQNLLADFK